MKKIASFLALVLFSAMSFAASITAPTVDFGTISIKGQTLPVTDTKTVQVSFSGLATDGYYMYAEVDQGLLDDATNPNGFWVSPGNKGIGYGVGSGTIEFTVGYSVKAAGTFTGRLHFSCYDTNYDEVDGYANITITVTNEAIVPKTIPFERITSLQEGDTIIFVSEAKGAVCGPLNTTYLPAVTDGVTIDATTHKAQVPETGVQMFRASKYSGNWQFYTLDATPKRLHLDASGKGAFTYAATSETIFATWKVEISSSGAATVCRPSDDGFPVEFNSDRFKPYKTPQGSTYQIYKKKGSAAPITSKLEVGAIDFGTVELGEEKEVVVNYTGENLPADIEWDITGTDAALFSVSPTSTSTATGSVTVKYLGTAGSVKTVSAKLYAYTIDVAGDDLEKEVPISITLKENTIKLTKIEFVGAPDSIVCGKSIDLKPYLVFTPGDAADKSLTWTVDKSFQGSVVDGVFTATTNTGKVVVTATSVKVPTVSASVELMNYVPKPKTVTLNKHELTTYIGVNDTLQALVSPDGASQKCWYTSRNTSIITCKKGNVDGAGVLTVKALCPEGVWVIVNPGSSATEYPNIKDSCLVKVVPVTVESVAFDPDSKEMTVGSEFQLSPVVTPAAAATQYTATYESNNTAVATVSETGLVTAVAEGTAEITCTLGGKSGKITITVVGAKYFTKVTDASTLKAKDTIILAAKVTIGSEIVPIAASSRNTDKKALNVAMTGVSITADAAASATVLELVLGEASGGFTLTPVGSSTAIAIGSNSNDIVNATASNNKVWEFLADGTNGIYVHNTGTNTNGYGYLRFLHGTNDLIKAYKTTSAGSEYVYVYVRPYTEPVKPAVTGVSLDQTEYSTHVGDAAVTLKATVTPSDADQEIVWTSSNEAIATVNASGKVVPKSVGDVTITAKAKTDETKYATCLVHVIAWTVEYVEFNYSGDLTIEVGETVEDVQATAYPTGHGFKVDYYTSNENIATVTIGGKITGVAEGDAVITAKSGDKEATMTVHVIKNDPTAIDAVRANKQATKVLREGQVIIIREEKEYDVVGRRVK